MKGYEPQVGDVVRVLVNEDLYGDEMDTQTQYTIKHIYPNDNVEMKRLDDGWFDATNYWIVKPSDILPVDARQHITSRLAAKMDQLNQLQREIAQLEAQLAEV